MYWNQRQDFDVTNGGKSRPWRSQRPLKHMCHGAKLLLAYSISCLPSFALIYAQLLHSEEKKQTCPSHTTQQSEGWVLARKMGYINSKLLWPRTQLSMEGRKVQHICSQHGAVRESCLLWAECKPLSFLTFPSHSPAQTEELLSPGKATSLQEQ